MKEYTYYFNDGTTSTVEVSDELYEILDMLDKKEENNNRKNTRRHSSYEWLEENGIEIADPNSDFTKENIENKKSEEKSNQVNAVIISLTPNQYNLLDAVYYGKQKVIDIAAEKSVVQSAISNQLNRIKNKFVKLL